MMTWQDCTVNGIPTLFCVVVVLQNIINFAIGFAAIAGLFLVVFSGVLFITSNGDKAKIETSKKTLTYAIIGLVVISLVFVIMRIISQLTGVTQLL